MRTFAFAGLLIASVAVSADLKGSADHPLFTRMPNFNIDGMTVSAFDQESFTINGNGDRVTVEGKRTKLLYNRARDAAGAPPSSLELRRNHQAAIKALGGEVLFDDANDTVLKLVKGAQETWARVSPSGAAHHRFVASGGDGRDQRERGVVECLAPQRSPSSTQHRRP